MEEERLEDLEDIITAVGQVSGRAGRDGMEAAALLEEVVNEVRAHAGLRGKSPLGLVTEVLGPTDWRSGPGDDGAVVADGASTLVVGGEALLDRFVAAAEHRYAERFGFAELVGLSPGAPGTAADRVRVFQGLERAVVAVILWDHLDDETRVLLAGPWAAHVEYAVGEA